MEKEQEKKNRPPPSQKARAPFTGDSLHPPHNANESEQTFSSRVNDIDDNNDAFADTSRTLHNEAESNGEEGVVAAAPAAKKWRASNPYHPGCCGTLIFSSLQHQYPKDLPQRTTLLIKEWLPQTVKKKDTGEEFHIFDLVDINGGL